MERSNPICKVVHKECDEREEDLEKRLAAIKADNKKLLDFKHTATAQIEAKREKIRAQTNEIFILKQNQIRRFDTSGWQDLPVLPAKHIEQAQEEAFDNWGDTVSWFPKDSEYRMASKEQVIEYILWNDLNRWKYIKDFFDCDDFAWVFRAMFLMDTGATNCGTIFNLAGAHDYCFFVFADKVIWMYEPQNDRWWVSTEEQDADMYLVTHARNVI